MNDVVLRPPRIFDGVTLRHFGAIEALHLIEARIAGHAEPRWTETVRSEILAGYTQPGCAHVLSASFLGVPYTVDVADLGAVFRLRTSLADPFTGEQRDSTRDLGEAESIFVADKFHGTFITDDSAAYDFAVKRLGYNRVLDTVGLLREAVAHRQLTTSEAQQAADAIRNSGRHLRREHPATFPPDFFAP
jgi:hypothetical protein